VGTVAVYQWWLARARWQKVMLVVVALLVVWMLAVTLAQNSVDSTPGSPP
jgi:uncharacterized membrane protein YbaN (DUF454 family)